MVYIDPTGEAALTTAIVYAGTIFTVASLQAWFNTPSGKKAVSTASGVIAAAITYTGKGTHTGVTPDGRTVNLHISSMDEGHPWTLELGNVKIRYR